MRLLLIAVLALVAAAPAQAASPEEDPFYGVPSGVQRLENGTVIDSREVTATQFSVPIDAKAWQVRFKTQDSTGAASAYLTTVLVPTAPWTGSGPRPVLSYQMAEDGVALKCAPSWVLTQGVAAPTNTTPDGQTVASAVDQRLDRGHPRLRRTGFGVAGRRGAGARRARQPARSACVQARGHRPRGDDRPMGLLRRSGRQQHRRAASAVVRTRPEALRRRARRQQRDHPRRPRCLRWLPLRRRDRDRAHRPGPRLPRVRPHQLPQRGRQRARRAEPGRLHRRRRDQASVLPCGQRARGPRGAGPRTLDRGLPARQPADVPGHACGPRLRLPRGQRRARTRSRPTGCWSSATAARA